MNPKKKPSASAPRAKYSHTSEDFMAYNEFILCGATKHKEGTKALFKTLDNIHALLNSKKCKLPYGDILIDKEYIDFEWTLDSLLDVFQFQLKYSQTAPIKNVGEFIFKKAYGGNSAYSPLLVWHKKMNNGDARLSDTGKKLRKTLSSYRGIDVDSLNVRTLNNVASKLDSAYEKYTLAQGQKTNGTYPSGIYSVFAKYLVDRLNNREFSIKFISGASFVDDFMEKCRKRNIIHRIINGGLSTLGKRKPVKA